MPHHFSEVWTERVYSGNTYIRILFFDKVVVSGRVSSNRSIGTAVVEKRAYSLSTPLFFSFFFLNNLSFLTGCNKSSG